MEKLVLLVDDDKLPLKVYIKMLERKGYKVEQHLEPDSALEFARKSTSDIVAVIMDIMLPPGEAYKNEDTNQGLRTGVFLYEDLRKFCPDVPFIVLTNVKNPNTLGEFKEGALLKVAQKMNYPPLELAELVDEMVKKR